MSNLTLFSYWRSSCSYRVRIALHYKNLAFQIKPVHLVRQEQSRQSYLFQNALGQVPSLVVGNQVINQTMAILFYLEDIHPKPRLLPFEKKNLVIELSEIINSGTQPLQNFCVLKRLKAEGVNVEEWIKFWITRGLKAFQKRILGLSLKGKYSLGDHLTWADVFLVPQLYNARRFKIDLTDLKRLVEIEDHCLKLECFQKALPENQEDASL